MSSTNMPLGNYGVYCEPRDYEGNVKKDPRNSTWLAWKPSSYEEACKKADEMCRANHMWHYYAKPIV